MQVVPIRPRPPSRPTLYADLDRARGQIVVIKYSGHAMVDRALGEAFAREVALLERIGLHPVVVHGGGPQIDDALRKRGKSTERVHGLRVTDEQTMAIVEATLVGRVNPKIVSRILSHGGWAVGLSGRDDALLRANALPPVRTKAGHVDLGRVGQLERVNAGMLQRLIDEGRVPVIAPIAIDADGRSLNVNADTVAGRIALELGAAKLVFMTNVDGVQRDARTIEHLTCDEARELMDRGVINQGMTPKVQAAMEAVRAGVPYVQIVDGSAPHCVLRSALAENFGTALTV